MEVCEFQGRIFGKVRNQLFVFEFSWDNVRPIEFMGWNGSKFEIVDKYKKNLFDEFYGFGSYEMKLVCTKLFNETEFEIRKVFTNPADFWKWSGTKTLWWRDRECAITSPNAQSVDSWRKFVNASASRPRTLKQKMKTRLTRRKEFSRS